MIEVELTKYEAYMAADVGCRRQISSAYRKSKSRFGKLDKDYPFEIHIAGALGELACAKALNIYWPGGVDTFKAADLGANLQVRTRPKPELDLIVRDDDKDEDVFILVTGTLPKYTVRGWIGGADAKQPQWKKNPNGWGAAYFIPQSALRPMDQLIITVVVEDAK